MWCMTGIINRLKKRPASLHGEGNKNFKKLRFFLMYCLSIVNYKLIYGYICGIQVWRKICSSNFEFISCYPQICIWGRMSIRIGMCHIGLRLQALLGRQNRKDRTPDAPGLKLNIPIAVRSIWVEKSLIPVDGRYACHVDVDNVARQISWMMNLRRVSEWVSNGTIMEISSI